MSGSIGAFFQPGQTITADDLNAFGVAILGAVTPVEGGVIELVGDVTGLNNVGTISAVLSTTGVAAGTYNGLTVDSKGRVTGAAIVSLASPQLLTATSGSFTVPAGVTRLRGAMTGAGGGGGGVSAAAATAGNGLAGVLISFVMVVTPGQVIAYANGAGGARGANTGGTGGTGGDTTFGTLTAKGGLGGQGSTSGNAGIVVTGATGAGFNTMVSGTSLIPTTSVFIIGVTQMNTGLTGSAGTGAQGKGFWGNGGTPGTNGSAADSTGYGAGGSGAGSTASTAGTGGLGAPGAILLY